MTNETRRNFNAGITTLLAAACLLTPAWAVEPPRYTVTFLDTLEGGQTEAYGLNDFGYSTGQSGTNTTDPGKHAFVGAPDGTLENIETLPADISTGLFINNCGQVAGETVVFPGQTGVSRPFRYTPGLGMVDLGVPQNTYSYVKDMNELGTVVGDLRNDGEYTYDAWVYSDANGLQILPTLGGSTTRINDVNNLNQIVGASYLPEFGYHAYIWENGQMTDLGTLGGNWSEAYYINDNGVVVGRAQEAGGNWRAFRYTPGVGMEPLPDVVGATSCEATWINNAGMIVGTWWDGATQNVFCYTQQYGLMNIASDIGGTAWTGPVALNNAGQLIIQSMDTEFYEPFSYYVTPDGATHDFDDLLANHTELHIESVGDINEQGQVIAQAQGTGFTWHAVLLTPVETGDMNCDGVIDLFDVDPFVLALTDPAGYAAAFPTCSPYYADINDDFAIDNFDIDPFVDILTR